MEGMRDDVSRSPRNPRSTFWSRRLPDHVSRVRFNPLIFAEVESRYGDGPFQTQWLTCSAGGRFCQRGNRGGGGIDALAGCHQRPTRRVMEFEIKVRHRDSAVGIPSASGST